MPKVDCYGDKDHWSMALSEFPEWDYVHTYDFHAISQSQGEGEPILFVVKNDVGEIVMCWPALKREIAETDLCDLTSVYGYGGPLIIYDKWSLDYLDVLFDVMRQMGVVSVFSRMHPLFDCDVAGLKQYTTKVSDVPIIDTGVQRTTLATYRKGHRNDIKKLLKLGFHTEIDDDCRHLDEFIEIYYQSMKYLGARDYFFFSKDFFENLIVAMDFKLMLSFVRLGDEYVCATLNIITGKIMHAHLTGDLKEYRDLSPGKLDYALTHEWALNNGVKSIILGPGRSQENDTLLRFKQGFGRITQSLSIFKKIINEHAYKDICEKKNIDVDKTEFFPAYRLRA